MHHLIVKRFALLLTVLLIGAIIAFGQASGVDVSLLEAAQRSFVMTAQADHGDSIAAVFEILRHRDS